jgi:transcriptional regulator with XRE-family HTH domain
MLRGARRAAGISQRELARRAETTQASISRIERGVVSPTVDTLERLLKECGALLEARRTPAEDVDRTLIRERLLLTPRERIIHAEWEWRQAEEFRRLVQRAR